MAFAINHDITTLRTKRGSFQRVVSHTARGLQSNCNLSVRWARSCWQWSDKRVPLNLWNDSMCDEWACKAVCTLSHLAQLNLLFSRLTRVSRALTIDMTRHDSSDSLGLMALDELEAASVVEQTLFSSLVPHSPDFDVMLACLIWMFKLAKYDTWADTRFMIYEQS